MPRFNVKSGRVILRDKSGAHTLTLDTGPGDFGFDEIEAGDVEALAVMHRGQFAGLIEGNEKTSSLSVTAEMKKESMSSATQARLWDFVRKSGAFRNAVSCNPGGADPWMCEVEWQLDDGAGNLEGLVFPCVRVKVGGKEDMTGNKLNLTGTAYVTYVNGYGRVLCYARSTPAS
jgi:hypothetical protein